MTEHILAFIENHYWSIWFLLFMSFGVKIRIHGKPKEDDK